jgi:hypothetical protein
MNSHLQNHPDYHPLHSLMGELEKLGWDAAISVRGAAQPQLTQPLASDADIEVTFEDNGYQIWRREYDRSHGVRAEEEIAIVYATDLAASTIDAAMKLHIEAERRAEQELDEARAYGYAVQVGGQIIEVEASESEPIMVSVAPIEEPGHPLAGMDLVGGRIVYGVWDGEPGEAEWTEVCTTGSGK